MKIGINLLLWTDSPDDSKTSFSLFQKIKKTGYDLIELPIYNQSLQTMINVGKELDNLGLSRTAVTTCSAEQNLSSLDESIRQKGINYLKFILDRCAAAGCETLVGPLYIALGHFSGAAATLDEWNRSVDAMYQIAEYAQDVDVKLALEPVNRFENYLINCAEQAERYISNVDHPYCQIMLDSFHSHIEEKSVRQAILTLKDNLIHFHISENDRSIPGKGQVRWQETFDALQEIAYDGPFVIEAFGSPVKNLVAATKIWRKMFKSEDQLIQEGLAFIQEEWGKRNNS
ncbi:MAG: sugar phosphate isomerase/epimerase [Planctomycetia bacterium]|nr:sugar phosphate isomerase/epimerase [Planctomycetia bacterium]